MRSDDMGSKMIHFAGRSCRFPGAQSVDEFADLLFSGSCAVSEIPADRWRHDRFFHPVAGTQGRTYSFAAGVVDNGADFDPAVFGISPREADYMDPQQRMLLHVVREALEDACLVPSELAGSNVGVFIGASMTDYANSLTNDPQAADGYMMTGNSLAVISNRISHVFDWHGPSMTIDTACSSSLFALEAATKALNAGQCDIAVVGGTNALLFPLHFIGFSAARMLSQTGLCQAFSANADGYVRAEGAAAVVLRRADAEETLPRSYGNLLHVGVNTSGSTVNIALPSTSAQLSLLEDTYRAAGVSPDQLAFVEAHGTGTAVGDPIEAEALGRAIGSKRKKPLPIGSVKSNIGHLEPAAGMAGIVKTLLALERGKLPPTLHADELNPAIPFDALGLDVVRKTRALPKRKKPLIAGISSFGFGGANAHAIVAGPERAPAEPDTAAPDEMPRELFFTSTFCAESLKASAAGYAPLVGDGDAVGRTDLLDELMFWRDTNPHRLAVVSSDAGVAGEAFAAFAEGRTHPAALTAVSTLRDAAPVFTFSGNGAQYVGMSRAAYAADPGFRAAYDEIDTHWRGLAGWSLVDTINDPELGERLMSATIFQPLLFADQVAMVRAVIARGLTPAAVLGHSGGEVAAAHISGALPLDQALMLIHARAEAQEHIAGRGTMAALQAPEAEARDALAALPGTNLCVAAVNSPKSVTLAGPAEEIDAFSRLVRKERRWACVRLKVNYPFHSAVVDEIEAPLRAALAFLDPKPCDIPFISSVSGAVEDGETLGVDYWWHNARDAVDYQGAVRAAASLGFHAFVEFGPDPVLAAYTRDSLDGAVSETAVTFAARKSETPEINPVLRATARAMVNGCRLDRSKLARVPLHPSGQLAPYPWQNRTFNAADSEVLKRVAARNDEFHPLLGYEADLDAHVWTNEVDAHLQPVLADHAIGGKSVLPGTALVELALAAAQRTLGQPRVELRDFDLLSTVSLLPRSIAEMRTEANPTQQRVKVMTRPRYSRDAWREHAFGTFAKATDAPAPDASAVDLAQLPGDQTGDHLYRQLNEIGLDYGPAFRRVSHYRIADADTVEVILRPGEAEGYDASILALDPVGADAVFHGLAGLLETGSYADQGFGFVPVRVGRLSLMKPGAEIACGRVRLLRRGQRTLLADVSYFDSTGALVAELEKVRYRAVKLVQKIEFPAHAFGMDLQPIDPLATTPAMTGPDLAALAETIDQGTADDGVDLLNAIALAIAYTAVREAAVPDPASGAVIVPATLAREARHYLQTAVHHLTAAGLVTEDESGTRQLVPDPGLPDVELLISGLLVERPDLSPEIALLGRLRSALPALIAGDLEWQLDAVYGRAALENLAFGSNFAARRRAWLDTVVGDALAALPRSRPARIVELSYGPPKALALIAEAQPGAGHDYITLQAAAAGAPVASDRQDLMLARMTLTALTAEEFADAAPVDLIISTGSELGTLAQAALMPKLVSKLAPGGVMIAAERAGQTYLSLLAGVQAAADGAPVTRYLDADRLASLAGHSGATEVRARDLADTHGGISLLMLRAGAQAPDVDEADETTPEAAVTALHGALPALLDGTATAPMPGISLANHGPARMTLAAPLPTGEPTDPLVIVAPDPGDDPIGDDVMKERLLFLRALLIAAPVERKPIWIVLPFGAGYRGGADQSPAQAAIWTFLRTAKNEYPYLDLKAVDTARAAGPEQAAELLAGLIASGTDETEIVLTEAGPAALRARQGAAAPGWRPAIADDRPARAVLQDDPVSGLDHLAWHRLPLRQPGPTEVVVEVAATGLNYRDVMWAMGLLPEEALENGFAGPTLGTECAGRIVEVGAEVTDLKPGQSVVALGADCIATHVTVDQKWTGLLPDDVTPEAATTAPVTFFSAYMGLVELARMRAGETVLIHGGAGGVGLAAIQLAQWIGARVIASAGSPVKRALLDNLGVDHVLDSRSLSFVADVEKITGGDGVDVVLNSLAGEAMERSLGLLRPFGRFVELGKLDYFANTAVGLRAMKDNISYFAIDIDQMLALYPDRHLVIFAEMLKLFREGVIAPLPLRAFAGRDAIEAFRTMQRSGHIGKIVIQPPALDAVHEPETAPLFKPDPDGVTVLVGGAGGLGLALADRLSRGGATAIALLGRSPEASPEARALIERSAPRGTEIRYLSCDITDAAAVDATFAELRAWKPITDVVHTAMVLEDMRIPDLTRAVLDRTMEAKTQGARNLDLATRGDPVNNFVVFTSMSTLIGNLGQAAYVAANGYLEALMRRRRADGLPGLAVGWGAILDVGYLARDLETANLIKRFGGNVEFTSKQALRALEYLMAEGQRVTDDEVLWISPMAWSSTVKGMQLLSGPTFSALHRLGQTNGQTAEMDDLRETLMALPADEAETRLSGFLGHEIARILRVPESTLNDARPVSELGMDSLMAVELGLAAQQSLGDDIPLMAMSDALSIRQIAGRIIAHLHGESGGDAGGDTKTSGREDLVKTAIADIQPVPPAEAEAPAPARDESQTEAAE